MTVLKYVGRARGVEVDATGVFVQNGDTADFPDDVAQSLLRQKGQWERVESKPKTKTPTQKVEAD